MNLSGRGKCEAEEEQLLNCVAGGKCPASYHFRNAFNSFLASNNGRVWLTDRLEQHVMS